MGWCPGGWQGVVNCTLLSLVTRIEPELSIFVLNIQKACKLIFLHHNVQDKTAIIFQSMFLTLYFAFYTTQMSMDLS